MRDLHLRYSPVRVLLLLVLGLPTHAYATPAGTPDPDGVNARVARLTAQLEDNDEWIRRVSVQALFAIGTEPALEAVLAALDDPDLWIREEVVRELGTRQYVPAVEPLIHLLRSDENDRVRTAAARALGRIGGPRAVDALIATMKDAQLPLRGEAIRALGTIRDPRAVEPLARAIAREAAFKADGTSNSRRHRVDLHYVAGQAASALGEIGGEAATEILLTILGDGDSSVRSTAAYALGAIGNDRALEGLVAALSDMSLPVRHGAAYGLVKFGWEPQTVKQRILYTVAARSGHMRSGDMWEELREIAPTTDSPLGANPVRGEIAWGVPTPIRLTEGTAETLWLEIQQDGGAVRAGVYLRWPSWPADRWRAVVGLCSASGTVLSQDEASFSASGTVVTFVDEIRDFPNFRLGSGADVRRAKRFFVSIDRDLGLPETRQVAQRGLLALPDARFQARAVALNGMVYLIGGSDGTEAASEAGKRTCFTYTPATDTWNRIAPLNVARHSHGAFAIDGKIWVLGGCGSSPAPVERYDPAVKRWEVLNRECPAAGELACVAIGGTIYLFPGEAGQCVTVYDTQRNSWRDGAPVQTPRVRCSAAAVDGMILVLGGTAEPDPGTAGPLACRRRSPEREGTALGPRRRGR